jgi:hypothetical protein
MSITITNNVLRSNRNLTVVQKLRNGKLIVIGETPGEVILPNDGTWGLKVITSDVSCLDELINISAQISYFSEIGYFEKKLNGFDRLNKLPNVEGLSVWECNSDVLKTIARLDYLKSLKIKLHTNGYQNHEIMQIISEYPSLEKLKIMDFWGDLTDDDLEILSHRQTLKEIEFETCKKITDEGFQHLSLLLGLESLIIQDPKGLSPTAFWQLQNLPNLRNVKIQQAFSLENQQVEQFGALRNLEEIDFHGARNLSGGYLSWHRLPFLKKLDLSGTQVADCHLASIGNMRSLETLHLIGCDNITDSGCLQLMGLINLRNLWISSKNIDYMGLVYIGCLPKLRFLDVSGCQNLPEDWVRIFTGRKYSRHLVISCNDLSEKNKRHLQKLPKMRPLAGNYEKVRELGLDHVVKVIRADQERSIGEPLISIGVQDNQISISIDNIDLVDEAIFSTFANLNLNDFWLNNVGVSYRAFNWVSTLRSKRGLEITSFPKGNDHTCFPYISISGTFSRYENSNKNFFQSKTLDLSFLGHFPQLHRFSITRTPYDFSRLFLQFKDLTNLVELHIQNVAGIRDDHLKCLRGLTNLTNLGLPFSGKGVTDLGISHLKGLSKLTDLDLRGFLNITDDGLMKLSGLPYLNKVLLRACPNLTRDGVEKFKSTASIEKVDWSPNSIFWVDRYVLYGG